MKDIEFLVYLLFVASWFLAIPTRIPLLGAIRFDLILVGILFYHLFINWRTVKGSGDIAYKYLNLLIIFALVTIPFTKWPGTVIKVGIVEFIKVIVFYYFSVAFINTEKKLKYFILVYVGCQSVRVFEPLFLHFTKGYWGSMTYGGGVYLNRLSGGPYDTVNPNGLAFIIVSIIPFYHFMSTLSWKYKMLYAIVITPLLYALLLTSSRSGLIALFFIFLGIFIKSKKKILLSVAAVVCIIFAVMNLTANQRDRYISLMDSSSKYSESAEFRMKFNKEALETTFKRPLFGYGLSTSYEVNSNLIGIAGPAHNLYIEVAQELGYIGLAIFLLYIFTVIKNFGTSMKEIRQKIGSNSFLVEFTNAMQVWLFMSIIFSFASYGLLTPIWYLFGGLSVVLKNICIDTAYKLA